jgi:hypothetical protein
MFWESGILDEFEAFFDKSSLDVGVLAEKHPILLQTPASSQKKKNTKKQASPGKELKIIIL